MNYLSKTIEELERCFYLLNDNFFNGDLSLPIITIQKARPNNLGHFTLAKVWIDKNEGKEKSQYEININPLNLNREPYDIIHTLLHEMVHYCHKINEIKDCNGQIHNKKFKQLAEQVGLICEKSKKYGWGFTSCSEKLKNYIVDEIKPNSECFEYFRVGGEIEKKSANPREKKTFKYICPSCGMEVKGKRDSNILCGDCGVQLEMEEIE